MQRIAKAAVVPAIVFSSLVSQTFAAPMGVVGYSLELNHAALHTYAYVFTGVVTCQGKACAGARVAIDIAGTHDQAVSQSVDADENGRYLLKVALQAMPQEMTTWHLMAKEHSIRQAIPGEAEGRTILIDETTVVVERPLRILEADL